MAETLRAIAGLRVDRAYANQYAIFRRDMVYGEAVEFEAAIGTLRKLSEQLIEKSVV